MPLGSFTLWTGLGAGIWVTLLTFLGYSLGAHTASMTYAEIVHSGKATISHNLPWILVGCGGVFAIYVLVQRRVMRRSTPASANP